jgi:hypothetical protein
MALDPILTLDEAVAELDPDRPLIVSDADEVLLQFIVGLESFLISKGLKLELTSFALQGNIKDIETGEPVAKEAVAPLLRTFFETVDDLQAVNGAPQALARLSECAQTLILSNVPGHTAVNRRKNLSQLGIRAPLVANDGLKGRALQALTAKA